MEELLTYLRFLANGKFWGTLQIKFQDGVPKCLTEIKTIPIPKCEQVIRENQSCSREIPEGVIREQRNHKEV